MSMQLKRLFAALSSSLAISFAQAGYVVTSNLDSGPNTLRDAITSFNSACVGDTTITFSLGAGVQTISPSTPLPAITCSITIDAYSGTGAIFNSDSLGGNSAELKVILEGSSCTAPGCHGLRVGDGAGFPNVFIKGLAIHSFTGSGVRLLSGNASLLGNYIGTDPGGMNATLGNDDFGVYVENGTAHIGTDDDWSHANLITANSNGGIFVAAPFIPPPTLRAKVFTSPFAHVRNSLIGGDRSGGASLGNMGPGVRFGGPQAEYDYFLFENFIRYNNGPGVQVDQGASVNLVRNHVYSNNGNKALLLNFPGPAQPTITSVTYTTNTSICPGGTDTHIAASVPYPGPNHPVRFEYFHNSPMPSVAEGKFFMGQQLGVADPPVPALPTVMKGDVTIECVRGENVTATASYDSCGECGYETSEYTAAFVPVVPPTVTTTFVPSSVALGNKGKLRIVVSNPNSSAPVGGINFPAALPGGLSYSFHTLGLDCPTGFSASPDGNTLYVSGLSMLGGTTCTIDMSFSPTAIGTYTVGAGTLSLSSDAGSATNPSPTSVVVSLKPPGMQILLPGPVAPGANATLTIEVSRSPGDPDYFSIGANLNLPVGGVVASPSGFTPGCSASGSAGGSSIAVGGGNLSFDGTCALASAFVTFAAAGTYTVSIPPGGFSYQVNGSAATHSNATAITASITVAAPAVSLSTTTLAFGNTPVGTTSSNTVTLTNTGSAPLSFGLNTTVPFAVPAPGFCPNPLPAGGVCSIPMGFAPTAPGPQSGTLTVTSNAAGSPHFVSLTGTGTAPAVSLSPSPLLFGNVPVGTTGTTSITLTNTGDAPLTFGLNTTVPFAVPAPGFCPNPLPAGGVCSIPMSFTPASPGLQSGTLTVTSNASGSPHTAPLSGTGTQPGISLAPSPADFGSAVVNTTSTLNVAVNNTGAAPLTIVGISVTGAFFAQGGTTCPPSLPAGNACFITVAYSPTATGPHIGQLSVSSNAPGSPHLVALSGTGTAPGVSLTPSPVAFGNVPLGGNASATLNLSNTGTAPLLISSIATTGTFFTNTTNCGSSLPAAASCQIVVAYAPTTAGSHTGQVSVITNAGAGPVVAPLSGTGAVPVLALTGTGLTFGSQTVGTASLPQTVTIINNGGAPLDITAITPSGDFNFTGCATPLSLAPGVGCTLSIKFVPTAVGTRSGAISITSNAAGSPHAITLSGDGTPVPVPGIALAPASADFGALVVGTNATQVLVLSNPGTAPLAISSIAASGAGFSQTNACPASLSPSASCNINVTFAPGVTGPASGQLAIVSNAAPSPLNAALSGSGLPATTAGITLSPASVAFPAQFVGTTSTPKTVTLTSSGTAPLAISQVTGSGDFAFSGCGPATLAPNATCTFSITFRPQSAGALTGSIVVTSNASGSPHTIALSGNGASLTAPEISLSPSAFGFDTLRIGRTATIVSRLTNTGAAQLAISQIQSTGAFFTQANNCPATLLVGGFCDVTVTYAPTAAGAHSGQLLVHSNAIPSPFVAAMSGTGIVVPPPFLSTSGPVSFGQQVTGTTVRRTLVLTNTGGDTLNISSMAIVGSGVFGVEGGCGTIAPDASCTLTITFLPTGITTFAARLDIGSNHSGGAVQVQLSGQGVALPVGDLDFSVAAIGFGNQTLGTSPSGPGQSVRLTNIGGAPVTISALRSTLPDFVVLGGPCIGTLQPRAFCDISVVFRPFRAGPLIGSLVVDSSPVQNDSVSLIGVGCRLFRVGQSVATLCAP